jgi:hypothetical protein
MIRIIRAAGLCVSMALAAGAAQAGNRFDVVVINHFMVRVPSTGAGVSFSCGLIVNTGSVAISPADIDGARFDQVTLSEDPPGPCHLGMSSSPAGLDSDLQPGEAFGPITAFNDTLRTFLRPGEVLRNTAPSGGALGCWIRFPTGYTGTVRYNVALVLNGEAVQFPVQVDVQQGTSPALQILEVLRVSSSDGLPALTTTWGRLKSFYR